MTREELADGASDAGISVLTGLSLYTENTYAATGTNMGASTRAPSTLGGRRAQRTMNKRAAKSRKGRVRQGGMSSRSGSVMGPCLFVMNGSCHCGLQHPSRNAYSGLTVVVV